MTTFRLLGEVEVWAGEKPLPLRGHQEALLLVYLLLRANRPATTETIRTALELPSDDAVRMAVRRLRQSLGPLGGVQLLARDKIGYKITAEPDAIDVTMFVARVTGGLR